MSELKPTDKGYIEALAKITYKSDIDSDCTNIDGVITGAKLSGFNKGYTVALEHNNVT